MPSTASYNMRFARIFGLLAILAGMAAFWYNWHLAESAGKFYIKLCILAPLAVGGGLLILFRPDWAGPIRPESTRAHKAALLTLIGFMAIGSGATMFVLKGQPSPQSVAPVRRFAPPVRPASTAAQPIFFRMQSYRLGSFNQRNKPTWEYVPSGQDINDWKTLLTIVDRPDARTREDLDRLAQGLMDTYKSHGGQILLAKTIQDDRGEPFNYMVAAFAEPAKQRYELNFVKIALGQQNAGVIVHGVPVADAAKANEILKQDGAQIGQALGRMALPDTSRLPRVEF